MQRFAAASRRRDIDVDQLERIRMAMFRKKKHPDDAPPTGPCLVCGEPATLRLYEAPASAESSAEASRWRWLCAECAEGRRGDPSLN